MQFDTTLVRFENISFFYPYDSYTDKNKLDNTHTHSDDISFVFRNLDLSLPSGVLSIVGENGIGKSTLMLLASARLFPVSGSIKLFNTDSLHWSSADSNHNLESERNALVTMVYQNMEFESQESIEKLVEYVFNNGHHDAGTGWIITECRKIFQLDEIMGRCFHELSKGEMQRTLIVLALAYGSRLTIMDEPVFAMEEYQKNQAIEYLQDYSHRSQRHLYFSVHNIDLCRNYADNTLLMCKDGNFVLGNAKEVCTRDNLEAAYQVPIDILHQREQLYRKMLLNTVTKHN